LSIIVLLEDNFKLTGTKCQVLPKGHSRPQIEPVVENISSGSREKRAE